MSQSGGGREAAADATTGEGVRWGPSQPQVAPQPLTAKGVRLARSQPPQSAGGASPASVSQSGGGREAAGGRQTAAGGLQSAAAGGQAAGGRQTAAGGLQSAAAGGQAAGGRQTAAGGLQSAAAGGAASVDAWEDYDDITEEGLTPKCAKRMWQAGTSTGILRFLIAMDEDVSTPGLGIQLQLAGQLVLEIIVQASEEAASMAAKEAGERVLAWYRPIIMQRPDAACYQALELALDTCWQSPVQAVTKKVHDVCYRVFDRAGAIALARAKAGNDPIIMSMAADFREQAICFAEGISRASSSAASPAASAAASSAAWSAAWSAASSGSWTATWAAAWLAASSGASSPGASSPGASSPGASSPGTSSPGASSPGASSPGESSPGASPYRAPSSSYRAPSSSEGVAGDAQVAKDAAGAQAAGGARVSPYLYML